MTHACYLLRSLNPRFRTRFYIGCTMDPRRRLRQHNGEIGQGARRTKAMRPWEMALCVYGFPSHVEALKFEWAWQHPFESIAVREAAARLPSFKGVTGMVTLVCTMVTLPKWSSVNLTLQFMTSDLLQYRRGGPQLPPQMRVIVAPTQSLPGKDSTDGNEDDDNLNTCSEDLSQSQPWDEERGLDHAHDTAGQAASMTAGRVEGVTSAAVKPKGKKGRKGKTPPGRKGKRGGNCRPSVDPILVELRAMGTDTRTSFAMTEGSCQGGSEITLDCDIRYETSPNRGVASGRDIESSVRKDSTMIATLGETSGRIETRTGAVCEASVDVSALSVRDRILLFRGFRTGAIEADLYFSDSDSENVGDFTASVETAANETAYTYSDSEDIVFDSGQIPEVEVLGDSLWGKRISRVTSGDLSDCLENEPATRGDMQGMKTGGGHTVSGSCSGQGSFFSEDTSSGFHAEDTPSEMLPKDHYAAKSAASEVKTVYSAGAKFVPEENLAPKSRVESTLSHSLCDDQSDDGLEGASRILSSRRMGDRVGSERVPAGDSPSRYKTSSSTAAGLAAIGAIGPPSGRPGEGDDSCGVARALPLCTEDGKALRGVRDRSQTSGTPSIPNRDSILPASRGVHVTAPRQVTILSDSDVEEIGSEEFRPSSGNGASGTTYSDFSCHRSETGVNGKMFTESHCVGPHQKTLTDVFRVRKNRPRAQSIYRKARNGETCEVLKDSSKGRNPPHAEQGFALSATATEQKCSEPCNDRTTKFNNAQKDFIAAYSDDDDEITEISAQEFQQPSSLLNFQSKRNVCTLRDVR